jgi:hypothetical protein
MICVASLWQYGTATFVWCIRMYVIIELLLSSDVSGCMLSLNGYFHLMYQGVCCHWTATFIWCIRVYVVIELLLSSDVSECMLSLNGYFHLMYQGVCCHWTELLLSSDVSGCMLSTATFVWCIRVYVGIELLLLSDVSGCMLALNCCFRLMYQGVYLV